MFRRERQLFSARVLVQCVAAVASCLLLYVLLQRFQIEALRQDLIQLNARHLEAAVHLEAVATQQKPKMKSELLARELTAVQAELSASRRAADAMANGSLGNAHGFSDVLAAVARRHIKGTWITRLSIKEGGRVIVIAGQTVEPGLIATYLQGLAAETSFAGRLFSQLKINRPQDPQHGLEFLLSTTPPEADNVRDRKNG